MIVGAGGDACFGPHVRLAGRSPANVGAEPLRATDVPRILEEDDRGAGFGLPFRVMLPIAEPLGRFPHCSSAQFDAVLGQ